MIIFYIAFQVYSWTDGTITMFTMWGSLDFPIFFLPSAWLLKKSLRYSVVAAEARDQDEAGPNLQVFGTTCMLAGSCLRCLPLLLPGLHPYFTLFCHAGASQAIRMTKS